MDAPRNPPFAEAKRTVGVASLEKLLKAALQELSGPQGKQAAAGS